MKYEKAGLKLNIQKTKIIASSSITSWQIDGKKMKTVAYFIFFVSQISEESKKVGLKLNIQKTKIMASSSITSWQIDGETMETVTDYFLRLQNHCRWCLQP